MKKGEKMSIELRLKLSKIRSKRIKEGRIKIWNKGGKHSPESIEKMSKAKLGKKLTAEHKKRVGDSLQGESVNYRNLHRWVVKYKGQPDICSHCNLSGLTGRKIHRANKSRIYKRELSDWLRLCAKCHKAYDSKKMANI